MSKCIKILKIFTAYTDNELDVSYLMEQAERLDEVLDRNVDLEDELGRVKERLQEVEHEAMVRQVDLENQLADMRKDRDSLQAKSQKVETEYSTLRRTLTSKEEDSTKLEELTKDNED